ncbi:MAG: hypothetical protein ACE14L_13235 [Terriglobales bacterium]
MSQNSKTTFSVFRFPFSVLLCGHTRRGTGNGERETAKLRAGWLVVIVLLCVAAQAQVQVGDYLKMNLGGSLGFGYGGGFGTYGPSSHSTSLNGTASLTGHYYHPNFISFNFLPYYNRSQSNSESRSIFGETGFTSTANFFTGSRFPGSVFFGKTSNSTDTFGIPGLGGLVAEGSSRSFGINWSALLPDLPTLEASFSTGASSSSLVGSDTGSESSNKTFSLGSQYVLLGFQLRGFYTRQNVNLSLPSFLEEETSVSTTSSYGISATHRLPLSGSFSAGYSRTTSQSDSGIKGHSTSDSADAGVTLNPLKPLTLNADVRYTGNLLSSLRQSLSTEQLAVVPLESDSRSVLLRSAAYLRLGRSLAINGYIAHREQSYRGKDFSDTQYGGVLTYRYSRPLLGLLYFSFGLVDTANQNGHSSLGFNGNVSFSRDFGRWRTSADFSYAQNVQTLLAMYTVSSYSYGGNVWRRVNRDITWSASYRSARSGLTQYDGNRNVSHNVTTGFGWRRYAVTANYSQSSGASVLTSTGLAPTPLGTLFDDFLVFNGKSYGLSLSATPMKKMRVTAYYSTVRSDTLARSVFSLNQGERYDTRVEYNLRKLVLRGGFTRTWQGISASGAPPSMVNSYYFGITRWFEVF